MQNRREVHDVDALEHTDRPLLGGLRERPSRPVARPVVIFYKLDPIRSIDNFCHCIVVDRATYSRSQSQKSQDGRGGHHPRCRCSVLPKGSCQKEKLTSLLLTSLLLTLHVSQRPDFPRREVIWPDPTTVTNAQVVEAGVKNYEVRGLLTTSKIRVLSKNIHFSKNSR